MKWEELARYVRNRRRTPVELQAVCRALGLPTAGNRDELRGRLEEHIAQQPQDEEVPWPPRFRVQWDRVRPGAWRGLGLGAAVLLALTVAGIWYGVQQAQVSVQPTPTLVKMAAATPTPTPDLQAMLEAWTEKAAEAAEKAVAKVEPALKKVEDEVAQLSKKVITSEELAVVRAKLEADITKAREQLSQAMEGLSDKVAQKVAEKTEARIAEVETRLAAIEATPTAQAVVQPEVVAQANVEATVASVPAPNHPTLFDAQSTGKEYQASYDIGVKPGQVGIVFGYGIVWGENASGGKGCGLVWLRPGWYPKCTITEGRYEIYDLPSADREGWIRVLVEQRAVEQAANYQCPSKNFEEVPVWSSELPSPPATPTATPARERRPTGQNQALSFNAGESVYGWEIVLKSGKKCTGGECYLASAPENGTVLSGVVNPWDSEVPAKVRANPWVPK